MRFACGLLVTMALALVASTAYANGRFPAANQIVVSPRDPRLLVLRSTYGYLFSRDGGCNWDWICESALGYGGIEDPFIGLTTNGTMLAATSVGFAVSPDTGCSWSFAGAPLATQTVRDFAVRPGNGHEVVAAASTLEVFDGGQGHHNQLFVSNDDGATWSAKGSLLDATVLLTTVDVSASDPNRFYTGGMGGTFNNPSGHVLVSTDASLTWTEYAVALDPGERAPYVAGVDPTNPDRVYVRTNGKTPTSTNRLLVSSDAGKTFKVAYTGGQLLGFALSADGSKVYVGGPTDGLRVAPASTLAFVQTSQLAVRCLTTSGGSLYMCSDDAAGSFAVGRTEDDGATFTPLLHLGTMRGALSCPGGTSVAMQCPAQYPVTVMTLGGTAAPGVCGGVLPSPGDDGGAADAGSSPPPTPPASKGCGCSEATGGAGACAALLGLGLGVATIARRKGPPNRAKPPRTPRRSTAGDRSSVDQAIRKAYGDATKDMADEVEPLIGAQAWPKK